MRVLQLGPYPPPHGGVQTNLAAIRDLLRRREHSCAVINLHRFRSSKDEDVYHPTNAIETLRLLGSLRYQIVHLHIGGDVPLRLLSLALVCALVPGTHSVLTFHSGGYATSEAGKNAGPRTLRGMVFRRFDRVIAVNQEIVELFLRFGMPADRIRLIAPHPLPARPEGGLTPELEHFFCAHSPVLITVGLLEPEYDLPLQIESLGALHKQFPKAGLVIAGAGSLEGELRERIAAQPWAEHILLPGDVPHAATLRAIAQADAFLRTTLYDGDSVAVREAVHFGTPVVATDNGMRPAGVKLIPARDRDALCGAIAECLSSGRPVSTGAAYGADDNIEAVLDLYRELQAA